MSWATLYRRPHLRRAVALAMSSAALRANITDRLIGLLETVRHGRRLDVVAAELRKLADACDRAAVIDAQAKAGVRPTERAA